MMASTTSTHHCVSCCAQSATAVSSARICSIADTAVLQAVSILIALICLRLRG